MTPTARGLGLSLLVIAGCTGSIDPGAPAGMPGPDGTGSVGPAGPVAPAPVGSVPAGLRRLTAAQYRNTVRALFGDQVKPPAELDRDDPDATFSAVGGYRITTSPGGVLKYEDAAYDIAHQVFAQPALLGCDPAQAGCAAGFLQRFGRRIWRRPLRPEELARYGKVAADVGQLLGDPALGLEFALAGLLQSPHFLYLPELGETVGGQRRFTSHEMASRLSYLLTDGPPDPALAAAADRNELVTAAGLKGQLERLLGAAAARPALVGFFGQLLELAELDDLAKDPVVYPLASPALYTAMRAEAEAMIAATTLERRGATLDLLDLRGAFAAPALARLYGPSERGGILTTAAWLSIQAKPYSSSPTLRGVWIREKLLCQEVPAPPPDVNNVLPGPGDRAGSAPRTTRQVLEEHRRNPECAACHAFFDELGVAFERFDGLGAARTTEDGLPIDPSGNLDGTPYATVGELIALLKADPRVSRCLVRNLYQAVTGHEREPAEDQVVSALAPAFQARPDFQDTLTAMVLSDWFRTPGAAR